MTIRYGSASCETPVAAGSKNPVWSPTPKFIFEVLAETKTIDIAIWDKAQTMVGTTSKKAEVSLSIAAFMEKKSVVEEWFPLGYGCDLHMKVRFVAEQVSRTTKVKNLRPDATEATLTELFAKMTGGVKQVFVNPKKQKGLVEFNSRVGYVQSMSLNGAYAMVVEPAGKSVDEARSGYHKSPGDTVKDMGKKAMASITGLFGGKKK